MNERVVSASLLSATQAVAVFTSVMPPLDRVRQSRSNTTTVADTRTAEKAGAVIVVIVGLIASYMVKDPTPAMIATVVALSMVALYETILLSTPKDIQHV